jgi:hypothetical protein
MVYNAVGVAVVVENLTRKWINVRSPKYEILRNLTPIEH